MIREVLFVLGILVFAAAFRLWRHNWARKLGALLLLVASFLTLFFLTDCPWAGGIAVIGWFFLPLLELVFRMKKKRFAVSSRLKNWDAPEDEFFPNASKALAGMAEGGFEHVGDAAWRWAGMEQFHRLHWNPEEKATAAVCLCEKENVAFAFIAIISRTEDGRVFRTTNFPFSAKLKNPPEMDCNHVPCERNCFHHMLSDHREYLKKWSVNSEELTLPDPDLLEEEAAKEMERIIAYNFEEGIITKVDEGHFRYSSRGLFFLWGQAVKDMIRLC